MTNQKLSFYRKSELQEGSTCGKNMFPEMEGLMGFPSSTRTGGY